MTKQVKDDNPKEKYLELLNEIVDMKENWIENVETVKQNYLNISDDLYALCSKYDNIEDLKKYIYEMIENLRTLSKQASTSIDKIYEQVDSAKASRVKKIYFKVHENNHEPRGNYYLVEGENLVSSIINIFGFESFEMDDMTIIEPVHITRYEFDSLPEFEDFSDEKSPSKYIR